MIVRDEVPEDAPSTSYYSSFGFSRAAARQIEAPYQGDAFMALDLRDGDAGEVVGVARYPRPFRAL